MTAAAPAALASPCTAICVLDAGTGWCRGCGRTIEEIAAWGGLDGTARAAVLAGLPQRLDALSAEAPPRLEPAGL